jgi:hypothetical protein
MNPRLRSQIAAPKSPAAREAVQYMAKAMNPVDGFGFVLDPADIQTMLASHRTVDAFGDNKTAFEPSCVSFPRKAFVQLQRQVAELHVNELPPNTSCIGPFNLTPDRKSLFLGFFGSQQKQIECPAEWFRILSQYVPQFHFYLRGYTIVAYHKGTGFARGIWVDRVQLELVS